VQTPRTYSYLKSFEGQLSQRSGMLKYFDPDKGDPFYSVYNVSHGTFAEYKVMWRQMIPQIRAAVIGPVEDEYLGRISPVTQHVVSVIAAQNEDEAHYLCAMLNSSIATCISASYSTGKSYGTPSVLDHVPIPQFHKNNDVHMMLVDLSRQAHITIGASKNLGDLEDEVDKYAADTYGVARALLPSLKAEAMKVARVSPAAMLPLEDDDT
jgi:hypothetical protein